MLLLKSNLITPATLHTLLPHEINLPSINEAFMEELTKQIEVSPKKKLIINYNLSAKQENSLEKLL